jgi:hypothetical protein
VGSYDHPVFAILRMTARLRSAGVQPAQDGRAALATSKSSRRSAGPRHPNPLGCGPCVCRRIRHEQDLVHHRHVTRVGEAPLGLAKADYAKRIATWEAWDAVAREAQGR